MSSDLITGFYKAFQDRDSETMAAAYAPDATFSDPIFPSLNGDLVRAMWKMFCVQGDDLKVEFFDVNADAKSGSARWEAHYPFGPAKRKVHNVITASFEFRDGRISKHTDSFDLYKWTRMALGPLGLLGGWTPIVQGQVRKQAASQLRKFMNQEA